MSADRNLISDTGHGDYRTVFSAREHRAPSIRVARSGRDRYNFGGLDRFGVVDVRK